MNRQVRKPKSKNRLKESIDSSNAKGTNNEDDEAKDIIHQHDPEKCEEAFKSNSKIDQMTQDR